MAKTESFQLELPVIFKTTIPFSDNETYITMRPSGTATYEVFDEESPLANDSLFDHITDRDLFLIAGPLGKESDAGTMPWELEEKLPSISSDLCDRLQSECLMKELPFKITSLEVTNLNVDPVCDSVINLMKKTLEVGRTLTPEETQEAMGFTPPTEEEIQRMVEKAKLVAAAAAGARVAASEANAEPAPATDTVAPCGLPNPAFVQPVPPEPKPVFKPFTVEGPWTCSACGAANEGGKFCQECGTAASWRCDNCGSENVGGKFCPECGTKRP